MPEEEAKDSAVKAVKGRSLIIGVMALLEDGGHGWFCFGWKGSVVSKILQTLVFGISFLKSFVCCAHSFPPNEKNSILFSRIYPKILAAKTVSKKRIQRWEK